jgi:hypothetical protein
MTLTIPATRYTKMVVIGASLKCVIFAFLSNGGGTTEGDELFYFTRYGRSHDHYTAGKWHFGRRG